MNHAKDFSRCDLCGPVFDGLRRKSVRHLNVCGENFSRHEDELGMLTRGKVNDLKVQRAGKMEVSIRVTILVTSWWGL